MHLGNMSRWLDVEVGTGDVDINTLPSNVALVDLHNDNEFKLLIGDLGKGEEGPLLRVFRGAMQISDMVLPDLPLGIAGFYTSERLPRCAPIVAVAYSSCIYMYRNMKLFYKYYLPAFELSTCETETWRQLLDPINQTPEQIPKLTEALKAIPSELLTAQSKNFVSLPLEDQQDYLEQNPELPLKTFSEIACIATVKTSSVDKYAVSCLVVGTEDGDVIVLDTTTFTQISSAKICTVKRTPYQIVPTGLYNVDYRLTIATREKCVCIVKRDSPEGRILFNTGEHIISIEVVPADNSVMVLCTDNTMACYSRKYMGEIFSQLKKSFYLCTPAFRFPVRRAARFCSWAALLSTQNSQSGSRGKKIWCISLEHRPVTMCLVPVSHLGLTLTAVALASGHLHLYDGKVLRDTVFVRDVVSVLKFGRLGQEEHVLVIVTGSGNLMLKILKRTAEFSTNICGAESAQGVLGRPWLIPKKSKLFLEQSVRERENALVMHEGFQYELNRLRLTAAKTLLEAHVKCDNSVGAGAMESMRLAAEVEGLGPVFRVTLIIENTSTDKAVIGLAILFHVHTASYKVSNPYIKVPLLSPGKQLRFPTKIEEIFTGDINPDVLFRPVTGQAGEQALVKVLLLKEGRRSPVLAATVQMPPTDPMMLPFDKIQGDDHWGN